VQITKTVIKKGDAIDFIAKKQEMSKFEVKKKKKNSPLYLR
jgi:hypothetical protein